MDCVDGKLVGRLCWGSWASWRRVGTCKREVNYNDLFSSGRGGERGYRVGVGE